jgi:HlyD family secretion protein
VDTTLLSKGVIAASEYRTRQNAFNDQQLNTGAQEASLHQQRITLVELEAQLADQRFADETQQRSLEQRLLTELNGLQSFVDTWRLTNEITAPITGQVHFAQRLNTGQTVKGGDQLFRVVNEAPSYVVEGQLPALGAAKVNVGMTAYIRLDGYPSDEFGRLVGRVTNVALIPGEDGYRIQVELPDGLTTSYHHTLDFRPEMKGQVDVLARDRSILGRIVDRLRGSMDR